MIKDFFVYYKNKFYLIIANILTPPYNSPKFWNYKNILLRKTGIKIGKRVAIDEKFYMLKGTESNIYISDNTIIGINCQIFAFNKINIGKFCMFGANVEITNGEHRTDDLFPYSKELNIGNGCWIGHGVKIIKGVNIGDNVIIGGGSVVINDIPNNSIAVGIPAKVIKMRKVSDKVWHLGDKYFCSNTFELLKDNKL